MLRSENNWREPVFSFHHMGSRDQTRSSGLVVWTRVPRKLHLRTEHSTQVDQLIRELQCLWRVGSIIELPFILGHLHLSKKPLLAYLHLTSCPVTNLADHQLLPARSQSVIWDPWLRVLLCCISLLNVSSSVVEKCPDLWLFFVLLL